MVAKDILRVGLGAAIVGTLACAVVLPAPESKYILPPKPDQTGLENDQADILRIIELTNSIRAEHSLSSLAVNESLTAAAQSYARYMASEGFFSHTGLDGSSHVTRSVAAGYPRWSFLGENLAAGQKTPDRAVTAWMESPTHRDVILAPEAREIGVGKARGPIHYRIYWTQNFGAKDETTSQ